MWLFANSAIFSDLAAGVTYWLVGIILLLLLSTSAHADGFENLMPLDATISAPLPRGGWCDLTRIFPLPDIMCANGMA